MAHWSCQRERGNGEGQGKGEPFQSWKAETAAAGCLCPHSSYWRWGLGSRLTGRKPWGFLRPAPKSYRVTKSEKARECVVVKNVCSPSSSHGALIKDTWVPTEGSLSVVDKNQVGASLSLRSVWSKGSLENLSRWFTLSVFQKAMETSEV